MSERFYKIGNTWYPWQTAHGLYGYTKTPTIRITYISTSQATWGQPESGYGFFDGDASEPQNGSYFHTSTWGWFDADTMAKTIWLMPSECEIEDIFFENDGEISPGARLIIDPSVSIDEEDWRYLIASVRNLGWHTLDEWEELGWVLSDPNTLYFGGDFSGNNIRMESVDGGGGLIDKYASYKTLFELRGWEPGGLFIDKPRMMGICGVLTETSDSVVLVEVPKQLSVGRIEFTGSLAEGGIPESGVVEEYIPAPVLPTVGNTYKLFFNSSGRGDYSLAADQIKNLYSSAGYTNSYDSTKSYAITGCYNSYGNVVIRPLPVVNNNNLMAVENKSGSTLTVSYVFICECSDNQAEVVTVFNASDEAYNAFKFTSNGTDYYYVLDNTQTDWTDDLSAIGYHLPPAQLEAYFAQDQSYIVTTTKGYVPLYDNIGNQIPYDSAKVYYSISYRGSSTGSESEIHFNINNLNNTGYLGFYAMQYMALQRLIYGYYNASDTLTVWFRADKAQTTIIKEQTYGLVDTNGNSIAYKTSYKILFTSPASLGGGLTNTGSGLGFVYKAGAQSQVAQSLIIVDTGITICTFNQNGSKTNTSLSYLSQYILYVYVGDMISYSSSASLLGVYAADGTQVSGTFELINGFNPSGYLAIRCTSGNVTAAYCEISMGS